MTVSSRIPEPLIARLAEAIGGIPSYRPRTHVREAVEEVLQVLDPEHFVVADFAGHVDRIVDERIAKLCQPEGFR